MRNPCHSAGEKVLPCAELHLPDVILTRILAFLDRGSTGQITLHVDRGKVLGVHVLDVIRVKGEDA